MKRTFLAAAAVFVLAAISISAEKTSSADKKVSWDIGIASGIPFYGSSSVNSMDSDVNKGGSYNRAIVGVTSDTAFKIAEPLRLILGGDALCDFIWHGDSYANHLDYAFMFGIKAYPGLAGFGVSCAYALGCRTDFYNTAVQDSVVESSSWGNGFRFSIEYNFAYGRDIFAPAIGAYWRCMPRGDNNWDNILAAYISLNF